MFMLHGATLLVAFIGAFPAGTIAIKLRSPRAFQYHWMIQVAAFILAMTGVIIGLVLSPNLRTSHHKQLGVVIGSLLFLQLLSGWRHHVVFLKIRRRTWISKTHTWLGRCIIGAGWCNLVVGLSIAGYADKYIYLIAVLVWIEAIALLVLHYRYRKVPSPIQKAVHFEQGWRDEAENNFALEEENSDEGEETEILTSNPLSG
jgi:hypothetical protein